MTEHEAVDTPCPLCQSRSLRRHCPTNNKSCRAWYICRNCKATVDIVNKRGWNAAQQHVEW